MEKKSLLERHEKKEIYYKTFGRKRKETKSIQQRIVQAGITYGLVSTHRKNSVLMQSTIDDTLAIDYAIFNNFSFPFENIVLEGGGMKGLGYIGAFQVLEEANILHQIKRVCGVSIGSVFATLLACGYSTLEMEQVMTENLSHITIDHSCGYCSLIPNLCKKYGWNPGERLVKWMGEKIKNKFGKKNLTFRELYEKTSGRELCIVITNLTQMNTEYFHVKTTPDVSIAQAVRMSIAIPGLFQASIHKQVDGSKDVYVDGGVLCNYPIHAFDGWWLSMKPEDSFFKKLCCLDECSRLYMKKERFCTWNEATLGMVLYARDEAEVMKEKFEQRKGFKLPKATNTKFSRNQQKTKLREDLIHEQDEHVKEALDKFLLGLKNVKVTSVGTILINDFKLALEKSTLTESDYKLLFDASDRSYVLKEINRDCNEDISYEELAAFITKKGVNFTGKVLGYTKRKINCFTDFLSAIESAMAMSLMKSNFENEDIQRTIGINTGYVGTTDFDIEEEDRRYVIECGAVAARAYLREYCQKHPERRVSKESMLSEKFFENRGRNKKTEKFGLLVNSLMQVCKEEDEIKSLDKDSDREDNTKQEASSENHWNEMENTLQNELLRLKSLQFSNEHITEN